MVITIGLFHKNIMQDSIKLELLYKMYLIRNVEEHIAQKYHENKMRCPTHLCTGQEAIATGVSQDLKKNDFVVSTHRSHGHYLAKGGNLKKMIAELYGKSTGCSKGYGGSMHLIDLNVNFMGSTAIVGNSIPVGVGLGLSSKLDRSKNITCIYFGEGSIEEGVFHEAINFSAQKKLPILFICENNYFSVYSPLKYRQPKNRNISKMIAAAGIESYKENGNDVEKIYSISKYSINKIRKTSNPIFLEFNTYRWREHCGPNYDNNLGYRKLDDFRLWLKKDPIKNFEKKLTKDFILNTKIKNQLLLSINKKIKSAFDFAEKSPFPKQYDAYKNVFAD